MKNIPIKIVIFLTFMVMQLHASANEGFFLGAGVNYNWFSTETTTNDSYQNNGNNQFGHHEGEISDSAPGGVIAAGYKWTLPEHNLFLELEAFAELYSIDAEEEWTEEQLRIMLNKELKVRFENGFGVNVKPGITLSDKWAVFGLVGYVNSHLDNPSYNTGLGMFDEHGIVELSDQNLNGLRLGAGVQYDLTDRLTTELAWTISLYEDIDFNEIYVTGEGAPFNEAITMDSLRNNQVYFRLNYYFGCDC